MLLGTGIGDSHTMCISPLGLGLDNEQTSFPIEWHQLSLKLHFNAAFVGSSLLPSLLLIANDSDVECDNSYLIPLCLS